MTKKPVTRFAPSPTGFLHIGGARTALFNWLFAQKHGGSMLLRIEDTDRARSTDQATAAILEGLSWLELGWDGEPVSQYEQAARHREVAYQLLEAGKAYRCFATPQELEAMREQAKAEKRPPRYDGRWRDRDPAEAPEGVPFSIRIKAPQEGDTIVSDKVQGEVRFPNKDLDDFIILRSDGNATYMLAVVVDDHDMDVTHIIRGDDHLTNSARQALIYKAMGWDVPIMAHIPLIHGPDGAKLSKRHGALGIDAYRAMGYLPQALRNYLVRLGWSHGDDEIMSLEQMIEWFALEDINKGAARFDFKKLEALNGQYMRATGADDLTDTLLQTLPYLPGGPELASRLDERKREQLRAAMPGMKERAKTLVELVEAAEFIVAERPLPLDDKASSLLDHDAKTILRGVEPVLAAVPEWTSETLEESVREFAEQQGLKLGKVAQPIRAALTGKAVSPGVFDVMVVLGREEALARLSDQTK